MMTEHEPHSPCSQPALEPGRPRRSRSTYSRLSPSQASTTWCSAPLTVRLYGTLILPSRAQSLASGAGRAPSLASGADRAPSLSPGAAPPRRERGQRLGGTALRQHGHGVAAVRRGAPMVVDRSGGLAHQAPELGCFRAVGPREVPVHLPGPPSLR